MTHANVSKLLREASHLAAERASDVPDEPYYGTLAARLSSAAAELGRKGGAAGTGKAKVRGSSAYYRKLSAKAVKARRAKK